MRDISRIYLRLIAYVSFPVADIKRTLDAMSLVKVRIFSFQLVPLS